MHVKRYEIDSPTEVYYSIISCYGSGHMLDPTIQFAHEHVHWSDSFRRANRENFFENIACKKAELSCKNRDSLADLRTLRIC